MSKPNIFLPLLLGLSLVLTGCFKDDERIEPYDRGDKITMVAPLTQNYKYQVYIDLDQQTIVSSNYKADFDLMFENSAEGYRIILNTSGFMTAARTGKYNMSEVVSQAGLEFLFDPSSGNRDSTAIGNWISVEGADTTYTKEVYVVDRGYDEFGNVLGFRKITFDSLIGSSYYFTVANLNGSNMIQGRVDKDPNTNYSYFSFNNGGSQVYPEPSKQSYDLLFTQYTTLLFTNDGTAYPYLVTGALINPFLTFVARDSLTDFDSISMETIGNAIFSNHMDVIGYNWKDVLGDVETGNVFYEVKPEYVYILRNRNEMYFKLRFVNFYATEGPEAGEKGYPTFEFQRL
jgi:hypothetical protein